MIERKISGDYLNAISSPVHRWNNTNAKKSSWFSCWYYHWCLTGGLLCPCCLTMSNCWSFILEQIFHRLSFILFELYPGKMQLSIKLFLQCSFYLFANCCLVWVSIRPKKCHWFGYKQVHNISFLHLAGSWAFERHTIVCTCGVPMIVADVIPNGLQWCSHDKMYNSGILLGTSHMESDSNPLLPLFSLHYQWILDLVVVTLHFT